MPAAVKAPEPTVAPAPGMPEDDPSYMPEAAPAGPSPDIMQALMGGVANAQQADPSMAITQALSGGGSDPWQGMREPTAPMAPAAPQQTAQAAPQAGGMGGINPAIIEALSSPYVDDQTKQIAGMFLSQQMQAQQQANDPMRAIEMERAQLELEALRNPQQKPIEVGGVLLDPSTMQPIFDSRQAPQAPSSVQEYEYARGQGYQGSYSDFQLETRRAGATNVTVGADSAPGLGKLSTDYGYVLDPETRQPRIDPNTGLPMSAPIPGSPAAREAEQAAAQTATRDTQAANSASVVLQDIDKALGQVSGWTAGPGSTLSAIPGTGARDLSGTLNTIKANIGFDRLQQMREASPTGGALGGIAVQELTMLQSVLGSLEQEQSPAQLEQNLRRLKEIYEPIARKAAAYPNAAQFGFGGEGGADRSATTKPVTEMTDAELEAIINGQ